MRCTARSSRLERPDRGARGKKPHAFVGRRWTPWLVTLSLIGTSRLVEACSVCFGNPDSPHTQAMSKAILALLVVIGGVLVCFATFFLYLVRKSKLVRADGDFGGDGGGPAGCSSENNGLSV